MAVVSVLIGVAIVGLYITYNCWKADSGECTYWCRCHRLVCHLQLMEGGVLMDVVVVGLWSVSSLRTGGRRAPVSVLTLVVVFGLYLPHLHHLVESKLQ